MECAICKEYVRVPVRFKCFPCDRNVYEPTCNSVLRVCMHCAREYLQLNQPRHKRAPWKRCLLCHEQTSPALLNAKTAYEKDYLLMSLDKRTDIPCPYDDCIFQGNQNELDRHMRMECPYRITFCNNCRLFYVSEQWTSHRDVCKGWQSCGICKEFLPRRELAEHQWSVHRIVVPRKKKSSKNKICNLCQKVLFVLASMTAVLSGWILWEQMV